MIRGLHTGVRDGDTEVTKEFAIEMGQKLDELAANELREIEEKRKKYVAKKSNWVRILFVLFVCDARRIFFLVNLNFLNTLSHNNTKQNLNNITSKNGN